MAFEPSKRTRQKGAAAAVALLDPNTTHVDYIHARGHGRLSTGVIVAGGVFVAAFLIMLALGVVIFPGAILLIYVYYASFPPRGVVVADQGVAILNRSFLNGRPNKVIALLTHDQMAQVQAIAKGSKAEMAFGPERLTFSKGEWARFTAAVQQVSRNWTGEQHLNAAGPAPFGPAAADAAAVNAGLPSPPPVAGTTPTPDSSYTGLPPIPGVDTPREEAPPSLGATPPPPGAAPDPGITEF